MSYLKKERLHEIINLMYQDYSDYEDERSNEKA